RPDDLQIAGQLEPRIDVHVVVALYLVLRAHGPSAQRDQVEIVLEVFAQVRIRVRDAEFIARSCCKGAVAANTGFEEDRDRTCRAVCERDLVEESPSISRASFDNVLTEGVVDRP